MRHLRNGHTAEHLRFDDLSAARVERTEALQRIVERQHLERCGRPVASLVIERHTLDFGGALQRLMTPRVIDEDLPHGAAGNVEEVDAIGPGDAGLIDQLEPGVVNELGWLQRMTGPFAAHQRTGDAAQFLVGGREQRLMRRGGTRAAIRDKVREVGGQLAVQKDEFW